MKHRLVLTRMVVAPVIARMQRDYDTLMPDDTMDAATALATIREHRAEAIFFSSKLKLTAEFIASLPESVRIAASCSVGYDHIDVAAAKARGLVVTNTPEVLTDCTADLAFLHILGACRRVRENIAIMEQGWRRGFGMDEMLGTRVAGKTLGILGMGRIGRAVAQRARGFDMKIVYHDVKPLPPELAQGATYFADFREMLPHCQILTLHAPGGAGLNGIMNAETFALLPEGAVFINAARGALVDEDALIAAMRSGHLAAAGLDAFRNEPAYDLRLRDIPNLFLTPHMGSATMETRMAMGYRALDNIDGFFAGSGAKDSLW
jgi:lactate dehydrogenase-like 2-hydroxyacid dehydrogenase